MKIFCCIFVFTLLTGPAIRAGEPVPFQVRIEAPAPNGGPIIGLPGQVTVVIRNDTSDKAAGVIPPRALVLRGVEWTSEPRGVNRWIERVPGTAHVNPDRTLTLKANKDELTEYFFELGLLLPGDEIKVPLPITPQGEDPAVLKITYSWVGDSSQWPEQILLPLAEKKGKTQFVPATADQVEARHNRVGPAVLRSTFSPRAPLVPLAHEVFMVPVRLPLAPNPDYQLTGGISIIEATWKSGADKLPAPRRGIYCAPLRAWFFSSPNGASVAYERVPVAHPPLPPTAPPGFVPKPWKWTVRPMPAMRGGAADVIGRGKEGSTPLPLEAQVFGDLLKLATPEQMSFGGTDETQVPADKIWAVLARAREKNLMLTVVLEVLPRGEPRLHLRFVPAS